MIPRAGGSSSVLSDPPHPKPLAPPFIVILGEVRRQPTVGETLAPDCGARGSTQFPAEPRSAWRFALTCTLVLWYIGSMNPAISEDRLVVERVQTGVRMEKRILKVLKAFAEYHDLSLGDLLEGIVLHAFDGKTPFREESLRRIKDLKKFYGLDLDANASHKLKEGARSSSAGAKRKAQ